MSLHTISDYLPLFVELFVVSQTIINRNLEAINVKSIFSLGNNSHTEGRCALRSIQAQIAHTSSNFTSTRHGLLEVNE